MERRTSVSVSLLLNQRGEPYLEWMDIPTSSLTGYKLDLAVLAFWENVAGQRIAKHVKLIFHPGAAEVWVDMGKGLERWEPTNDPATGSRVATACGLTGHSQNDLRAAVESFVGAKISVPELRASLGS